MEVDVVLCNFAEAADNKLYVSGGGVNLCFVQPEPPHVITLGLGIVIHVPYQLTNQSHTLGVELITEDGQTVVPFAPEGVEVTPVSATIPFNVGRPSMVTVGDEQTVSLAMNLMQLPLREMGAYSIVVSIDGTEMRRQSFRVQVLPPTGPGIFGLPQV